MTSTTVDSSNRGTLPGFDGADVVPQEWPSDGTQPATHDARPIGWLLFPFAPLGVILRPTATGCRLARSSWLKAVAAHVASLMIAGGLALAVDMLAQQDRWADPLAATPFEQIAAKELTVGEWLRLPLAATFNTLYHAPGDIDAAAFITAGVALHLVWFITAVVAMPFVAVGEKLSRLLARSVKLVLWSSLVLVPALLFYGTLRVQLAVQVEDPLLIGRGWLLDRDEDVLPLTVLIFVPWWLNVFFRLTARYPGPAEGPGWQSPPPRCNGCGYTIVGLPRSGRCPECGRGIAESLPTARQPSVWTKATRRFAGVGAFVRTVRDVLADRRYFRTLSVRRPTREAGRFAAWVCAAVGAIVSLGVLAGELNDVTRTAERHGMVEALLPVACVWLAMTLTALTVIGLTALRAAFTVRADPRITWNAVLHASAFLLPAAAAICVAQWINWLFDRYTRIADWFYLGQWGGAEFDARLCLWVLLAISAFAVSIRYLMRLRRAILDIRFAA